MKKILIIIPAYNEEKNISLLYSSIKKSISGILQDYSYEIIFVDDGSTDRTFDEIKKVSEKDKNVHGISFQKNFKKSAAYMAAFKQARGDIIITMDADLQDDPKEIPRFIKSLETSDLVIGWKYPRYDPIYKTFPSKIFNRITYKMYGTKLHDSDCGYRAMKSEVAKNLNLYGDNYRFIPALASKMGYRVSEIKVQHHKRRFGKSKYGGGRFVTGLLDIFTVKFVTDYFQKPMHVFGSFGLSSFMLGVIAELVVLYYRIFQGDSFSTHLPLLILGVLLMILGVQLFGIGLLGELITSSEKKKNYVIREIV